MALVVHTILAFVLMNYFDLKVWGLVISTIVFAVVLCVLNNLVLWQKLRFRMNWKQTFGIPLIASVFMGVMCWGGYFVVQFITKSNTWGFFVAFLLGVITYFIALFMFNGVTEEELNSIPKGYLIVRLAKKLHLFYE